uniref:Uncharacterized protein n=1 Tax=Romanomermis culicivorax TaxID=13658 RepID=A0A915L5F7_ROMCU
MHESIKSYLEKATNISKNYFNTKARRCDITIDDPVLLTNTWKANKIQPNFIGPFIIMDTAHLDENIVTIDALNAPGRPQVVFTLRLKPFIPCTAKDTFVSEASGPNQLLHT